MQEGMIRLLLSVNASILMSLKESEDEFVREMLFFTAFLAYRKRRLSLGKAAELAGYDRLGFVDRLRREGEPVFDFNADEVDEIFNDAASLG
jgi:predicted HTH domain antitoxin